MADLHDLSALEQAAAVRAREVSPVELVEHYLDRIERIDQHVGAFVTVTDDLARRRAKEAEAAVIDGGDLPSLHGVPIAIKDLNMVSGVPTKLGSAAYDDFVAPYDDNVVSLLMSAGTICLGKTNTPEFGLPCYTEPDVAPAARTPWDLSRSAGGSSGGAAAAVAAGLVPFAQGNDGGGSIRIPSSVCGLFGIKPTRGRVSNGPLMGDVHGLAWNGPIARTVRDAAVLLDVMSTPMPGDPHWAPPPSRPFLSYADRDPGRLRVGRYITPVIADAAVHPDCVAAYEDASELLESLGHDVVDVTPPFDPHLVPLFEVVWAVAALSVPVDPSREHLLRPLTRWLRDRGRGVSAAEYVAALSQMQLASRAGITTWQDCDSVLTPTLAQPPALVGGLRNDDDPLADFEAQKAFTPFTATYNVTGQPAMNLPLYWTADGLPIGVMLAGRPAGEATLISIAAQVEAARPWHDRHPALW